MSTLFISDLHLCDQNIEFLDALKRLLAHYPQLDRLYLLGDLFEYWIGDDVGDDISNQFAQILQDFRSKTQCAIYCIPGNRDFLMGTQYLDRFGATLLPDPCRIDCYGRSIVLTHGDTIHHDPDYLNFRKWVHDRWIQRLFLSLPTAWRRSIAQFLRRQSQKKGKNKVYQIVEPTSDEVSAFMNQQHAELMIHGHTHFPRIELKSNGTSLKLSRIVLSDWTVHAAHALVIHPNWEYQFISIPIASHKIEGHDF